jgi:hypothetical protein
MHKSKDWRRQPKSNELNIFSSRFKWFRIEELRVTILTVHNNQSHLQTADIENHVFSVRLKPVLYV